MSWQLWTGLIAQMPPVNNPQQPLWPGHSQGMSGEWSNPSSWSYLVQVIGIPAFLFVLFFLTTAFFSYMILKWFLGEKGWVRVICVELKDRWLETLGTLKTNLSENEKTQRQQVQMITEMRDMHTQVGGPCNVTDLRNMHTQVGGSSNVTDLRSAGHVAAEALRKIGRAVKADGIDEYIDKIHHTLQESTYVAIPVSVPHVAVPVPVIAATPLPVKNVDGPTENPR